MTHTPPSDERCGGSGLLHYEAGPEGMIGGQLVTNPCPGCPDCAPSPDSDSTGIDGDGDTTTERCRESDRATGVEPSPDPVAAAVSPDSDSTGEGEWTISVCKCGALSTGGHSADPEHGFSHTVDVVPLARARALAQERDEARLERDVARSQLDAVSNACPWCRSDDPGACLVGGCFGTGATIPHSHRPGCCGHPFHDPLSYAVKGRQNA